jgi:hypothetical protein
VRDLESSRLAGRGAGEGALLVAEELRFEQRIGNRGAVDRHEWSVGAGAERVQAAGEELLAGAALPLEENRGVGRRRTMQLLQDVAQRAVLADDPRRPAALGHLLLQQDVIRQHPPLRDGALDHQQEVIGIDRLRQEIHRALAHGRHRILNASVGGHDDDLQLGIELLGRAQHAEAIAVGQLEVGQHHGGAGLTQLMDRFGLVPCLEHGMALRFQRMAQHRAQRILIFDEENGK